MTRMRDDLARRVRDWIAQDPVPATRDELGRLLRRAEAGQQDAVDDLAARFAGPLQFGTAGLRGPVGAGESRMNVAVVMRATHGVAQWLLQQAAQQTPPGTDATDADPVRVVVGCDARHGSAAFRQACAHVLAGAGIEVLKLPRELPTPVLAYAVRALGADAGIMITASHNPAPDNGYKVYLGGRMTDAPGNGVQIAEPTDAQIAACIARAPGATQITMADEPITAVSSDLVRGYLERAASLRPDRSTSAVSLVVTPMHGVGGATAVQALHLAGFPEVHLVEAQATPDPDFPTVPFPNPEEPGALDLALSTARDRDADVVVALDPDADRCSVAVPTPQGWRQLSGDQIGALLGAQAAADPQRDGDTLATSLVSSRLLGRIARATGLRHAVTLTGFKWIARVPGLRFGYEEAIGYCTDPTAVRDKDGISAAVRVATLVEELAGEGRTVTEALDDLARTHGLHATRPLTFRVSEPALLDQAMARLRRSEVTTLVDSAVVEVRDLARGTADLPPTEGVLWRTAADDRVILRPSGTEPKLKCYLEVILPVRGQHVPHARAEDRLDALARQVTEYVGL